MVNGSPPHGGRERTTADRDREIRTDLENNSMGTANSLTVAVTDDNFTSEIEQSNGLVLVDFWATWCGPCQMIAPVLEQLAGEYQGQLKVGKVDVDANQRTAMRFNVRSIPSILFFKNGNHVDTVVGNVPRATLDQKIKQHI
jgi:thioredoxin 1